MLQYEKTHPVKVAIIEYHRLVRQAFNDLINDYPELNVVLEAEDGSKFLKILKQKSIEIDVVLLDLFSPHMDGRDALKEIYKLYPLVRILILSACTDQKIINDTFELGAYGFISKMSEPDELHEAILSAAKGQVYRNKSYNLHQKLILTPTEVKVLELIWEEKTNDEIARIICISLSAVEKIKHQLKEKTQSRTTVGLIKYALKRRIINPTEY